MKTQKNQNRPTHHQKDSSPPVAEFGLILDQAFSFDRPNFVCDPFTHNPARVGLLRVGHELGGQVEPIENPSRDDGPDDPDVPGDGDAGRQAGEAGHFHAEGNFEEFRFGQSFIDGGLYGFVATLGLPDLFEGWVQVDADQGFAFEGKGGVSLPSRPKAVAGVGFKRSIVDFLGQGDGGFDDDIGGVEHFCQSFSPFGDRNAVADGESDAATADELRNGHQDREVFCGPDAEHGSRVASLSRGLLEGFASGFSEFKDVGGKLFDPQAHGVAEIAGGFDDDVAGGGFEFVDEVLIERQIFSDFAEGGGRHLGQFEGIAEGEPGRVEAELGSVDAFDAIEHPAHFVGDDGGAGGHAVDDVEAHQFGNEGGDAFVNVGSAAGDDDDFFAALLGGHDGVDGLVDAVGHGGSQVAFERCDRFGVDGEHGNYFQSD